MSEPGPTSPAVAQPTVTAVTDEHYISRALEVAIRIALVVLLVGWCFQIVRPFVNPVLWAVILAIATRSTYTTIERAVGGRSGLAATLFALAGLVLIIGPSALLTATIVDSAGELSDTLEGRELAIPPPPEGVGDWPIIGGTVERFWTLASTNLEAALASVGPQLRAIGAWLLSTAAGAGVWILQFSLSIAIAAVLQANAAGGQRVAHDVARRLLGDGGPAMADLAQRTVRNVTRGILGVALIQSLAAGLGLVAAGVPAAGLWALLCMVLAVIQLPTLIVLLPVTYYVSTVSSTFVTVAFLVWSLLVGLSDNVLKPILLGRGSEVPMLVIFLGAIGGFMTTGIIGLFIGSIVLSVGYKLFVAWLEQSTDVAEAEPV